MRIEMGIWAKSPADTLPPVAKEVNAVNKTIT